MKTFFVLLTSILLTSNAFGSGYGGYDQEPIEISPVEITLTSVLQPTCEAAKASLKVSFGNTCEDKYEFNTSCNCVEVDSANYCEYKTTIACTPFYDYY